MWGSADKTIKWFVDSEGGVSGGEAWAGEILFGSTRFDSEREAREEALRRTSELRDKYANIAVTHARWIQDDNKRIEEEKKRLKVGDRFTDDVDGDEGEVLAVAPDGTVFAWIDKPNRPYDAQPFSYHFDKFELEHLEKIED